MFDPTEAINYDLNDSELETAILFWVCAAGKNGITAARCLQKFLNYTRAELLHDNEDLSPFQVIKNCLEMGHSPPKMMKHCGIGCYTSKARSFRGLIYSGLDLRTCSTKDLEKIHGIGFKTSRCFILFSRKGARVAGLDTHMLKHLRALGYNVPRSTPSNPKQYAKLEQYVLELADEAGMTPAEYDLSVWLKYSVPSTPGGKNGSRG